MDFQKITTISFISILILATTSIAVADDSFLVQTSPSSKLTENSPISLHGYVEDISWVKKVSTDGVIEIDGITFSITNDDETDHLFEICALMEGPVGKFTPSSDSTPACTSLELVKSNQKLANQSIEFTKGVKISDMVDISITIQEI